jgi:hypothetical protein
MKPTGTTIATATLRSSRGVIEGSRANAIGKNAPVGRGCTKSAVIKSQRDQERRIRGELAQVAPDRRLAVKRAPGARSAVEDACGEGCGRDAAEEGTPGGWTAGRGQEGREHEAGRCPDFVDPDGRAALAAVEERVDARDAGGHVQSGGGKHVSHKDRETATTRSPTASTMVASRIVSR